jgi:hypothetical protein
MIASRASVYCGRQIPVKGAVFNAAADRRRYRHGAEAPFLIGDPAFPYIRELAQNNVFSANFTLDFASSALGGRFRGSALKAPLQVGAGGILRAWMACCQLCS